MYKVTDVSALAPCLSTPYNGFLCENTVFAVWLCEKGLCNSLSMIFRLMDEVLQDVYTTVFTTQTVWLTVCRAMFSVCNLCPQVHIASNHQSNLASVTITSPRTRGRNFSPSCHNSSREALSKHLASLNTACADCTQRATIWKPVFLMPQEISSAQSHAVK